MPEAPGVATYHLRISRSGRGPPLSISPGPVQHALPARGRRSGRSRSAPIRRHPARWSHTIRVAGNVDAQLSRNCGRATRWDCAGPLARAGRWTLRAARTWCSSPAGSGWLRFDPRFTIYWRIGSISADLTLLYGGAHARHASLSRAVRTHWSTAASNVETTVDRPAADWAGERGVVTLLLDRLQPSTRPATRSSSHAVRKS